jgi:hypothetical protein
MDESMAMFMPTRLHNLGLEDDRIISFRFNSTDHLPSFCKDIPFLKRGVPCLHLIPVPFPDVWHKESDNPSNMDVEFITQFNTIFRIFMAELLHL